MIVPTEVYYLIGGGVTYLILKDIFKFVRWGVEKITRNNNPVQEVVQEVVKDKNDREVLELILRKTESTGKCLNDLKLDFVKYKTMFGFLSEAVKEQNGSLKVAAEKMSQMAQECATRLVTCRGKFEGLEKK